MSKNKKLFKMHVIFKNKYSNCSRVSDKGVKDLTQVYCLIFNYKKTLKTYFSYSDKTSNF